MPEPEQFKPQENLQAAPQAPEVTAEKLTDLPNNPLALANTPEEASVVLAQKAAEKSAKILKPQMERFAAA